MSRRLAITGFILVMSVLYVVFLRTLAKPLEASRHLIVQSDIFTERGYLKSPVPVALHFYADWCRSCREEAPAVDAATREWDGKLKFIKVNVDLDDWSLANAFGIHSIPSVVILNPHSKAMIVHNGLLDAYELHEFIVNSLNLPAAE